MNGKIWSWLKKDYRPLRKRKVSPFARKVGWGIQLLFVAGFCWFAVWRVLLYRSVTAHFANLRAAGLPASGAELNTWRQPVPDAENGALILTQAFALIREFPTNNSNAVSEAKNLSRTNFWSPAARELVEAFVQMNGPAVAKVREGLRFPRFRYDADFSFGPETLLPHLRELKALARIVELETALEAEAGHVEEWPERVELQLKIAGTINDEPALISHLVYGSILRMAATALERSLNRGAPGAETCKHLQSSFASVGATNRLAYALAGERALMVPVFRLSWKEIKGFGEKEDSAKSPRPPQRYSGKPMGLLWLTGMFERDLNFYLETYEKTIDLARLPAPQSLSLTNYLQSAGEHAAQKHYLLSMLLLPSFSRVLVREVTTEALIRLSITALAVERFRSDRGRVPNDLRELIPEFLGAVPLDPFDGTPLRYRALTRGYAIYSVGADGHDNSGREPAEHRKSSDKTSYDITFIVER